MLNSRFIAKIEINVTFSSKPRMRLSPKVNYILAHFVQEITLSCFN